MNSGPNFLSDDPTPSEHSALPDSMLPILFESLVSILDTGVVVVNAASAVCFVNHRAEEILHIRAASAVGQGLITVMRDYQVDTLVRDVLQDGEMRDTAVQPIASGRMLRLRCMALSEGATLHGALLLISDITQISMLERARRDLVANVSHELRTPLASLKLLVETLQSHPPADIARRMMEQMEHEIDVVIQLSEELHELSQLESGRVVMQFVMSAIDKVIEAALNRIRPQSERKNIQMTADYSEGRHPVLIDEQRIGQVLINLLHNAVKFTAEGGQISVKTQDVLVDENTLRASHLEPYHPDVQSQVSGLYQRSAQYRINHTSEAAVPFPTSHPPGLWMLVSICDTGIGIPTQELPRIFERFYKVDRSRTRETGGSGLGLAIAKHLIEGHGGRLWADSQERRGSTFYFTLPLA